MTQLNKYCGTTIEYANNLGGMSYHECSCPAKYLVEYIRPSSGKLTSSFVCGRHFIALQKNVARILKRTKFDCQFTFKKI